ncbi:MAG: hypothetical protein KDD94_03495 [Calditrichaeota bacterium]|nr:hypothetical protein [Calditrichota bacterium]
MQRKSKSIAISLIALFAGIIYLKSFHQSIIYQLTRAEIRREVREADSNSEKLTIFLRSHLDSIAVLWIDSKEFIYQSEMYDIIREEMVGKDILVYCIKDTKEKELIAHYFENFVNNQDRNPLLKKIVSLVTYQFDLQPNNQQLLIDLTVENNYCYIILHDKSVRNSIFRPPQQS